VSRRVISGDDIRQFILDMPDARIQITRDRRNDVEDAG